jgi:hypothetical protein
MSVAVSPDMVLKLDKPSGGEKGDAARADGT